MESALSIIARGQFWCCLLGVVVFLPGTSPSAESADDYRVSLSLGAEFNIAAKFRGHPGSLNLQNSRNQAGAANFDNGYVGPDVSGDTSLTTFWGYEQADQRILSSGNVIGLRYERTTAPADSSSPSIDAGPSFSGGIMLRRRIANTSWSTFGLECGASYTRLDLDDNSAFTANGQRTDYSFGLPGPVDAGLFPSAGYQGPFNGLGPVLNLGQSQGRTSTVAGAVTVNGNRRLEADVFGFRLGPYLEFPFTERFSASISGGAAVALLADRVTWTESVSVNSAAANGYWAGQASASGTRCGVAYGYYVAAEVSCAINTHWNITADCQMQGLGSYEHQVGLGEVQLDLRRSLIVSLGASYRF